MRAILLTATVEGACLGHLVDVRVNSRKADFQAHWLPPNPRFEQPRLGAASAYAFPHAEGVAGPVHLAGWNRVPADDRHLTTGTHASPDSTFAVTHTAYFSGTLQSGSASAVYTAGGWRIWLPLVAKNATP